MRSRVLEDVMGRARSAIDRPSPYGPDIDLNEVLSIEASPGIDVEKAYSESAKKLGLSGATMSGAYIQIDSFIKLAKSLYPGLEVVPIEQAVDEMWDEVAEYFWKAVDPATDKYTAVTALKGRGGHFIKVKKGSRVTLPFQSCFVMRGGVQLVHNIVVLEEGAELVLVTGCANAFESMSLHVGVTEIYLHAGARLYDVMIHGWNRVTHVRPRTGVVLNDNAQYISYYVNISESKSIQFMPAIHAGGSNSKIYSASVILGSGQSIIDVGHRAVLSGEDSSAELISRVVSKDSSRVVSRLKAEASNRGVRAYLECSGLILSPTSAIETVPELSSSHPEVDLHHEASIGRLRDEEIDYLVLKGFDYREAVALLVRGFVDVGLDRLPAGISRNLQTILDLFAKKSAH